MSYAFQADGLEDDSGRLLLWPGSTRPRARAGRRSSGCSSSWLADAGRFRSAPHRHENLVGCDGPAIGQGRGHRSVAAAAVTAPVGPRLRETKGLHEVPLGEAMCPAVVGHPRRQQRRFGGRGEQQFPPIATGGRRWLLAAAGWVRRLVPSGPVRRPMLAPGHPESMTASLPPDQDRLLAVIDAEIFPDS